MNIYLRTTCFFIIYILNLYPFYTALAQQLSPDPQKECNEEINFRTCYEFPYAIGQSDNGNDLASPRSQVKDGFTHNPGSFSDVVLLKFEVPFVESTDLKLNPKSLPVYPTVNTGQPEGLGLTGNTTFIFQGFMSEQAKNSKKNNLKKYNVLYLATLPFDQNFTTDSHKCILEFRADYIRIDNPAIFKNILSKCSLAFKSTDGSTDSKIISGCSSDVFTDASKKIWFEKIPKNCFDSKPYPQISEPEKQ